MSAFNRFLYDTPPPKLIDVLGVPSDAEQMQRNAERVRRAIEQMGQRWCCWNPQRNAAGEEELMLSSQSHTEEQHEPD